jgi:4-hydroxy-2-oxoglutarate aldolase
MRDRLTGVFPPIPTNFDAATGDIDTTAMTANVRKWMTTGLAGVLVLGTNGEAPLLSDDEGDRVVTAVRDVVPADRLLMVGTGRESTPATVAASVRAAASGADVVLVRVPSIYKTRMDDDALVAHFTAVADGSPVPVLLYNIPALTGISLTVSAVRRLAGHPNIAGMKETSTNLERLGAFAAVRPGAFQVLCGSAPILYPGVAAGAVGGIVAVANVLPDESVALFRLARSGGHDEALTAQRRLTHVAQLVTSLHGVPGLKAALDLQGYSGGAVRPPLQPVSEATRAEIASALAAFSGSA